MSGACSQCHHVLAMETDGDGHAILRCGCGVTRVTRRPPTPEERGPQHGPLPSRSVPRVGRAQGADHPWKRRKPQSDAA